MSNEDREFIVQRNIERFTRLLATEDDQDRRNTLGRLLREEQAKQSSGASRSDA